MWEDRLEATHKYQCAECTAEYDWLRGEAGRVYLRRSTCVEAAEPTAAAWLKSIDPASWGAADDQELRHVMWCPDPRCQTRARWSRLLQLLRSYAWGLW
jgi:hypothetical protein